MRKDFLTDPYQVLEARAAGAGGVLVILAMLDDATVRALVDCAQRCGLFVLLEAFDRADLERLAPYDRADRTGPPVLAGVNCRDLRDLDVHFARFAELAPFLPRHLPAVAESGIGSVAAVEAVAADGYRLALIGSALMRAPDPARHWPSWLAAGRDDRKEASLMFVKICGINSSEAVDAAVAAGADALGLRVRGVAAPGDAGASAKRCARTCPRP